jgi:lipopolysaccharide biosynthesis glycosyltransferase
MNHSGAVIPIVFAANEHFIPYTSAMIQSIMENAARENQYRIYILHSGISAAVLDMLSSQAAQFPYFSIEGIDISDRIKQYHFFTANRHDITQETYYRLFIPELLSDYEKVIYLDGDMICRSDISKLYAFDLGNNLIGAARDIPGINSFSHDGKNTDDDYYDVKSNMENPCNYFCAGMLLINIKQFQKTIATEQLLDLVLSRKWKSHDQDVLNFLSLGKTLFLPYSWNFIHAGNTDYLPENLVKEYAEAVGHEDIIHFAGVREKPWISPVYVRYFELFWKYAARTPFIDTIIDRMKEINIIGCGYESFVIEEIKHRNGGLRFILKCFKAWLNRLPDNHA